MIWSNGSSWTSPAGEVCSGLLSGSRASSPLPSAFFSMVEKLLCQIDVSLGSRRCGIVEHDGASVAGGFSEGDVSGNGDLEDLGFKMSSDFLRNLARYSIP